MDLKELDSFKMSDAIAFHDQLNPKLFHGQHLRTDVDEQLKVIAQDFLSELGIKDLDVKDITISGSNAAYSYTPHSDLDLHILVDLSQYSDDAVYQELFHAKKNLYNESHDITINGIPVELYIQDASEPVVSLGEYSILKNKWLRLPTKRRSNLDQTATKKKYEKLSKLAEYALHSKDLSKVKKVLETIKRYRQAGLDVGGEFGPENLAYKVLRSQGIITKLYDLHDKLHSQRLSIEGMYSIEEDNEQMYRTTPTIEQLVIKYKVPKRDILIQLDKGIKVELKSNKERDVARKIALNHLRDDPHYYNNIDEDYDPNGPPPGPETKPTMPAGTVKVDVSDVYDWYKLGQHISNLKGLGKHDFGSGPPSTILSFGDENTEHKYINDLEKTGLTTTDIDPFDPNQPKGMKRQKTDPTYNVSEGFDQPYPITWEKSEYGDVDALAKLPDGKPLAIMFNRIHNDDGEETIQVRFFRNNTDEISGEGDAQRVFATVLTAIQQYIEEYKPARINFSANKEKEKEDKNGKKKPGISRAKLYDRMVQRYAKAWGYRSFRADNGDIVIYELSRINKVSEASFDGIEISLEKENDEIMVTAMANGKELGQVLFVEENGYLLPQDLEVDERYRGQGIASTMYDYVKSQGYKIRRSGQQTDAGAGFWDKHRPEQNVWEDDTMQYASEKTSAVNPYGGLKDNQYRGSISEGVNTHFFDDPNNIDEIIDAFGYKFSVHKTLNRKSRLSSGNKTYRDVPGITIKAYDPEQSDNLPIGHAKFVKETNRFGEIWVESDETEVSEKYRGKGIATMMYAIVKSLGFDIKPSQFQSNYGERMWSKWGKDANHLSNSDSMLEASGYIPSEKQKNDPRFSTALTVDVKPDSIKKNAKAFGWLTSRAGIPPTAKPSGKV